MTIFSMLLLFVAALTAEAALLKPMAAQASHVVRLKSSPAEVKSVPATVQGRSHSRCVVQMADASLIISAWDSYNRLLEAHPLATKSVTASILLAGADCAAQAIEKNADVDLARVARFAIFGLVLQAPWNHFYYLLLDGAIPPTPDPVTPTNLAKVAIDQFLQAPVFTAIIFVFLGALEGQNKQTIQNKLQADWWPTMQANWKLWIPATAVNIGLVPPPLRVLYINVVFFFWAIYLSTQANRKTESE